jgi:hypothetical protein
MRILFLYVFPPLSTKPRLMHAPAPIQPQQQSGRYLSKPLSEINRAPLLALSRNARISRGSCVLGASSSNHPQLRPACDHDRSLRLRGRNGAETDGRRGKGGGTAWQPRRPAPVSPSATEPAPTSGPRISRHPHRARRGPPAQPKPKRRKN